MSCMHLYSNRNAQKNLGHNNRDHGNDADYKQEEEEEEEEEGDWDVDPKILIAYPPDPVEVAMGYVKPLTIAPNPDPCSGALRGRARGWHAARLQ